MEARLHDFIYLEEASVLDEKLIGPLKLRNTVTLIPGILLLHAWLTNGSLGALATGLLMMSMTVASIVYSGKTMTLENMLTAYIYSLIFIYWWNWLSHRGSRSTAPRTKG
ncbi:MAG: hypothetical protein QXP97_01490 [Desulfurococcus sp.]|uniref:hypothetical protein n=1 Tax=Desulfurococcus sp. TaxID=51678 RepID=UPI00315E94ED